MRRLHISILMLLGVSFVAAAHVKKEKIRPVSDAVPYQLAQESEPVLPEMNFYTDEQFKDEMKQAQKRGQRKLAANLSEGNLKSDFRVYRDRFLALKNTPDSSAAAESLDQILFELEQDSPGRSADLEFFAAQLTPLRSFRGFFHRVRPLARKYPIVQSYIVTMAKQMASNVAIFLSDKDSENMKVVFRYISEPYKYTASKKIDGKDVKERVEIKYAQEKDVEFYGVSEFTNEAQIQNWLMTDVVRRLNISISKLLKLDLKNNMVVWDNRILAGSNSYEEDSDRFRALGEAEKNSVLSNFYGNVSNIYVFNSYSAYGLLALVREMGFLYGVEEMDAFNPLERMKPADQRDVVLRGASAEERTAKINKFLNSQKIPKDLEGQPGIQKLFTLLPMGVRNMKLAYAASLASNTVANVAWKEIRERGSDDNLALDGAIFRPFANVTQKSLDRMTAALKGNLQPADIDKAKKNTLALAGADLDKHFVPIRSAINSDVVQVNVVKFFFSPPKNLREFLPDDFEKGELEFTSDVKNSKNIAVRYRNYFKGMPISWKEASFKPYFKVSTDGREISSDGDIKTILRVTNQSWGGLMIGATLNSIML